jgi:hypothetical protein
MLKMKVERQSQRSTYWTADESSLFVVQLAHD